MMGLLFEFFRNLFGKPKEEIPVVQKRTEKRLSFAERWELEQQERIAENELEIRKWLPKVLRQKAELPFSWDSGNDEAFITFADKAGDEDTKYEYLEQYIVDKLDIPSAGEFKMNGKGSIYIEGQIVKVKYSSVLMNTIDYNEETDEEIYGEEELDSGDMNLFVI